MKISVILGHPYKKSFNKAIADIVVNELRNNNYQVYFHDLCEENFNPVITSNELFTDNSDDQLVITHCKEIKEADGIVIIHPNWWGQPPAILKGWIDRVLRQGVAYSFEDGDNGGGLPIGLLKAKAVLVFNTSNTPEKRELSVFGDPLENIWKACVFEFCGVRYFYRKMYRVIADSTLEQRQEWLKETSDIVKCYFPKLN